MTREALQSVPSDALTALDLDPPLLVMVLMQLAHESNAAHQDSSSTQRQRHSHQPEHGSNQKINSAHDEASRPPIVVVSFLIPNLAHAVFERICAALAAGELASLAVLYGLIRKRTQGSFYFSTTWWCIELCSVIPIFRVILI